MPHFREKKHHIECRVRHHSDLETSTMSLTGTKALEAWAKKITAGYENVNILNMKGLSHYIPKFEAFKRAIF